MSYYSANHLQADWESDDQRDHAERLERAELEAGQYFAAATVRQQEAHHQTMVDLRGLEAPRYQRERAEAARIWTETTADAAALYDRTVAEIMATGEVSEDMAQSWGDLIRPPIQILIEAE